MGFGSRGKRSLSEINVTPLVDVMLVLLIIFMVTAPLIQQGVEVKLPEAKAEPVKAEDEKLILSVKGDKSIWLGAGGEAARGEGGAGEGGGREANPVGEGRQVDRARRRGAAGQARPGGAQGSAA